MRSADSSFVLVAETGERFADFGPYVAALNDAGVVAFRAQLAEGGSALILGEGGTLTELKTAGELVGHPDLNNSGSVSFISRTPEMGTAFWLCPRMGSPARVPDAGEIADMGPRGPVMNEAGSAVFCARLSRDGEAVYCATAGRLLPILTDGEVFRAFPGLPVINRSAAVAFAAELTAGGSMILLINGGMMTAVADTLGEFEDLGSFPSLNDSGAVAFTGTLRSGSAGAFLWSAGNLRTLADSMGRFESFRSVLLHGAQGLILCATPRGGQLGIYRGSGAEAQRVLGLGDRFLDSSVADFALNAVSVNASGQIALRLRLANGRQLILRAEPSAP